MELEKYVKDKRLKFLRWLSMEEAQDKIKYKEGQDKVRKNL
jgi:hypothetical protein